jgi:hypothetical protein
MPAIRRLHGVGGGWNRDVAGNMTDAELENEWLDLVDDVENGLIQRPEQQFEKPE